MSSPRPTAAAATTVTYVAKQEQIHNNESDDNIEQMIEFISTNPEETLDDDEEMEETVTAEPSESYQTLIHIPNKKGYYLYSILNHSEKTNKIIFQSSTYNAYKTTYLLRK